MNRVVIPLILLVLFSCGETEKLFFHIENSDVVESAMLDNKFTIFCYVDSVDCNPCVMYWLHRWTHFEDELKKMKAGIILIVRRSDKEEVHDLMIHLRLNFPVIFDGSSIIKHDNEAILNRYSVFVVNRKKEVVWLGVPIESRASWNLFCKTLRWHRIRNFYRVD